MMAKQDDIFLETLGTYTIKLAPLWIPGGIAAYWYFFPEKVNPWIQLALPYLKKGGISLLFLVLGMLTFLIVRFIIVRKKERERYLYYRIVPHVDQRLNTHSILEMVEQWAGYRRPKRTRWFRGREWFQWLIHREKDGIAFYVGFPSDRKSGILRTLENAYPEAEFHAVDEVNFPSKKAYGGRMKAESSGVNAALPFASYQGGDGIGNLVSYMEKDTWIDVTFSPSSTFKLMMKLRKAQKKMKKVEQKLSNMDSFEKERFKDISGRLSGRDKVFSVAVSVASDHERAYTIVQPIATTIMTIMSNKNALDFRRNKNVIKPCPYPIRHTMDWTGRELANLLHLPDTSHNILEDIPHLNRGERNLKADELSSGVTVGYMKHPVVKDREVQIPGEIFKEHNSVTGKTGAGKSSLILMKIQSMINSWLKQPNKAPGFTLFDPAKETAITALNRLLKAEAEGHHVPWEKVHYISFKDTDYPVALNLFHRNKGEDTTTITENIMGLFKTAYPGDTFKVDKYLMNTIKMLLEDKDEHVVLGIPKVFTDEDFRGKLVKRIQDPILKEFWENQTEKDLASIEDAIYNRVNTFQSSLFMRRMFGQKNWSFDLKKWMDEGHIVLIDMLGLSDLNMTMTVGHLITQYHQVCNTRRSGSKLHMVMVDECHLVQIPIMPTIIAFDRKFGLGLSLISQSMKQYKPFLKDAISEIMGTIITGAVGDETAQQIERITNGRFKAEFLKDLPPNTAAVYTKYKDKNGKSKVTTCTVETEPPYIYLPNAKAATYGNRKEMDEAFNWSLEKARELQARDGEHYSVVDKNVKEYLGVKEADQDDQFFEGGGESKVDLTKTDVVEEKSLVKKTSPSEDKIVIMKKDVSMFANCKHDEDEIPETVAKENEAQIEEEEEPVSNSFFS